LSLSRKTGLWVVLLAAVITLLVLLLPRERSESPAEDSQEANARRLERLRSVPYTSLTETPVDSTVSGVLVYDRDRACPGYNLYCSRIRPEVRLIDMEGNLVHVWTYPSDTSSIWDHAIMLENGDVVVIEKFKDLLRLDWDSNLLWKSPMDIHHDIVPLGDGTFYAIVREVREYRGLEVRFPAIVHVSADGIELGRWPTYEHLDELGAVLDRRSFLDTVLDSLVASDNAALTDDDLHKRRALRKYARGNKVYDYFHMNTIGLLPETPLAGDPRFRPGNLLVCFRNVNQIAILDRDSKEILWAWGEGELEWPHHPTMLANGDILVFDNGVERKASRVVEMNPETLGIEWQYVGDPPSSFYTFEKGSAQRLPNGNTLISEGNEGRVFEVTKAGEIVWEWLNPEIGELRRVQIYRMERLPTDLVERLTGKAVS
jgi:hypothetical protein